MTSLLLISLLLVSLLLILRVPIKQQAHEDAVASALHLVHPLLLPETHASTHARTHARTHAHTHTHTHTHNMHTQQTTISTCAQCLFLKHAPCSVRPVHAPCASNAPNALPHVFFFKWKWWLWACSVRAHYIMFFFLNNICRQRTQRSSTLQA